MEHVVITGDCRTVMADMAEASVDAVVCDPPYELNFMGKGWDNAGVAFDVATWTAVRRVMKPGAYLLAFGGTRTYHRMACAIEDAGFEIKDSLCWLHGQGFPKHKSLLKPAFEPVILAKKRGAGVLNIDGCRIDANDDTTKVRTRGDRNREHYRTGTSLGGPIPTDTGRWPANVALDEDAAALLDRQAGERTSGKPVGTRNATTGFATGITPGAQLLTGYGDTGGASRFYYVAKASRSERNAGLAGMDARAVHRYGAGIGEGRAPNAPVIESNHHPTVKPVALMQWLVRLVTPPDGLVLDPFAGSGTTGIACVHEGFRFVGIEQSNEYADIARARIAHAVGPVFAAVAVDR